MSNKDELLALLSGISLLEDDLDRLNNDLSTVRRDVTSIEKVIKAAFSEEESVDAGRSDVEVDAVVKNEDQSDNVISVLDVIRELETEEGPAHVDTIVTRAAQHGFDKNTVEAEIARLESDVWIYEPARSSGVYRTTIR